MSQEPKRSLIPVETKVLDGSTGLVEYIASDESIDSYGEIIRAKGWRFDRFSKNAPFVDSHKYDSLECLLGKVVDFRVEGSRLIETVQWAVDVPSNQRARIGWDMTRAGYLRAVSVGFFPTRMVTKWDEDKAAWKEQLAELKVHEEDGVRAIYVEQQQVELSAVVVPANSNALIQLAKGYKAGVLTDRDIEFLSGEVARANTASAATSPGHAADEANARGREQFLARLMQLIERQ